MNMRGSIYESWFTAEIGKLYERWPTADPGILLGCAVWGDPVYRDRLLQFCLPSLMSPANLEALRAMRCRLVLFTDDFQGLWRRTAFLEQAGISLQIRALPKDLLEANKDQLTHKFWILGTVQNLLVQMAARQGWGFHMLMPDHLYGHRYMPSLQRLSMEHEGLPQAGVSIDIDAAKSDIEAHRRDAVITIEDRELGDMAVRYMHQQTQSALVDKEDWAHHNILVWRGQDGLHLANPLINPAWLSPRLCRQAPVLVPVTLDGETASLMPPGTWHIPAASDGMTFLELSDSRKAAPDRTDFQGFAETCWEQMNFSDDCLPFFRRRTVVPTTHEPAGVPEAEIEGHNQAIVDALIGIKPRAMEAWIAGTVRRMRRMRRFPVQ